MMAAVDLADRRGELSLERALVGDLLLEVAGADDETAAQRQRPPRRQRPGAPQAFEHGVERVAADRAAGRTVAFANGCFDLIHVGHIRSTFLGDCLARVFRLLGHRVITDNHIGDWGTQFGMMFYGYRHFLDAEAYRAKPVHELARLGIMPPTTVLNVREASEAIWKILSSSGT